MALSNSAYVSNGAVAQYHGFSAKLEGLKLSASHEEQLPVTRCMLYHVSGSM